MSPVENFARLGLMGPRLVAVHMTQLTDAEIKLLSDAHGAFPALPFFIVYPASN